MSGHYAKNLPDFIQSHAPGVMPFLYESTGVETRFRDQRDPAPRSQPVFAFHRPETFADWLELPSTFRTRLAEVPAASLVGGTVTDNCTFHHCNGQFQVQGGLGLGFPILCA